MFKEMKKYVVELLNEKDISFREKVWRRLIYTVAGDPRFDLTHPSIDLRIQQIEDSLNNEDYLHES
jgi:hypothetical protein